MKVLMGFKAQTALMSGRMAIEGQELRGQAMYNHALAFRHTRDRGARIILDFVKSGRLMPRWGSNNGSPAPLFDDLEHDRQTTIRDWARLVAAGQFQDDGNKWWQNDGELDIDEYDSVRSADAAHLWFRSMVSYAFHSKYVLTNTSFIEE